MSEEEKKVIDKKKKEDVNEAVVVDKVIKDLADTDWGEDNEAQMKAVQLLKGLAISDDPKSNSFMKKLSAAATKIGNGMNESDITKSRLDVITERANDLI